jgi:GNAT superfamily N-acetyltransferase
MARPHLPHAAEEPSLGHDAVMPLEALVDRARRVWVDLAGVPVGFPLEGGIDVVTSAGSRLCPTGWSGVVVLGGAGIATVPRQSLIDIVREVFAEPIETVTDADRLRTRLAVREVLGPATLAYLDEADFRPYRRWPGSIAHMGVLTASEYRGQGLARIVASAAAKDALQNRLLPQWRARPASSRRVAQALGFRQLGTQLSLRIEH